MGNAEYMGTHPIFESDFDCLTERESLNYREEGHERKEGFRRTHNWTYVPRHLIHHGGSGRSQHRRNDQSTAGSARRSTRQNGPNDRGRGARLVRQIARDFSVSANSARVGGAVEDLRRYSRPVHGLVETVRVRRIPARVELLVPWRLCRSGQAVVGVDLSAPCLQDQIPGEFLFASWESRVRLNQSDIWLL